MSRRPEAGESGFTLIELMISLGLFALIAVAGLALVEGIINVQGRTEKRLDRLADLQRTMFVVSSDVEQIADGRLSGSGSNLSFTRAAPGMGGAAVPMRYGVAGGALVRAVGPAPQIVLAGVANARWRFWDGAWLDRWPVNDEGKDRWPRAVALELQVAGPGGAPGSLRRVIALPVRAEEPKP
ncbi:prepilin-type N-terminal cleavage/methylation domain-containing protein [Sphingomonas gei]|uniref:Type II secretion system protein J n=1 Tax=Sphingomonas gei TaxID=1395960 RepID=A0A4S1XF82_9SPHN|nr:type II secretion system protein GspJ [Sphingomonas gei]TGX54260.1 prepilin-type N-terminal cleavage/methylation domain-containing protein [Sphingomonas gei]